MNAQLIEGSEVTVISFGGKKLKRTVVKDLGEVILICKADEFAQASVEKREPIAIGFNKKFVISDGK